MRKPAVVMLTLAGLLAVLGRFERAAVTSVMDFAGRETSVEVQPRPLEDPAGAMRHFYEALRQRGITRIVHYGDSPVTADLVTGDARRLLQARFGDAGHGFSLVARPWAWYEHRDVGLRGGGWRISPASQVKLPDGMYGLGGVSFEASGASYSRIVLRDASHTHAEVSFLRQPGGGSFDFRAEGQKLGTVATEAAEKGSGFAGFDLPAGTHTLEIRGKGRLRLFGIVCEKPGPGVVYDSLGLNGAHVAVLARTFQAQHWEEQLRHRAPDLVILNYGTNESGSPAFIAGSYETDLREVVRRIRQALPEASLLLMSPMDRGRTTLPPIPRLVEIQRRVARETGCAFFDTFTAMGGSGTMGRWYSAQPRLVAADFIHPTPEGAEIVGGLLADALAGATSSAFPRSQSAAARYRQSH